MSEPGDVEGDGDVRVERRVAAAPSFVYRYLTQSDRWARWQGIGAVVDARPGGRFEMRMANGMVASGRFVELGPNRRVVFTWGWATSATLPPGSSTVEVELVPDGEGTVIRLTHRGLPPGEIASHRVGWTHYLPRLAAVVDGVVVASPDPGPG